LRSSRDTVHVGDWERESDEEVLGDSVTLELRVGTTRRVGEALGENAEYDEESDSVADTVCE
jgi:hypothetical protein